MDLKAELEIDDEKYSQYFDYCLKKIDFTKSCSWGISADYLDSLQRLTIEDY